jgi:hypothetical protein
MFKLGTIGKTTTIQRCKERGRKEYTFIVGVDGIA